MNKEHRYITTIEWTGNTGTGTSAYRAFDRSHIISSPGKPSILGSSDVTFMGDAAKYNPEELLLGSLSACHMLWYLHLCATSDVIVRSYLDRPKGLMLTESSGKGRFATVTLHPLVGIGDASMMTRAMALHEEAATHCFIANSVNFPVRCYPKCFVDGRL